MPHLQYGLQPGPLEQAGTTTTTSHIEDMVTTMTKARIAVVGVALFAMSIIGIAAALADPQFGPGNGQQNGDKCHPPGQTVTVPGCK
jgi:hypothetical protein